MDTIKTLPVSTHIGTRTQRRRYVLMLLAGYPLSIFALWLAEQMKERGNVPLAVLFGGGAVLAFFATVGAYFVLMRRTVVNLPNLPEKMLDERQRRVRDDAFRTAYVALAAVITVMAAGVWLATMFAPEAITVTNGAGQAIWWGVFLLTGTLPTAVIAWNTPDPEDE